MLDKDAQESLLKHAAEVNEIILAVSKQNVEDYNTMVVKGSPAENELYKETFGKEARQSLKIRDFIGSPDTSGEITVKIDITDAITNLGNLMKQRETDDEAVKEKLKIAKVASTVSSTSRTSQTLKDLLGGDYFKDGDEKVYIHKNPTVTPLVAFSLPVKSDTTDEDYEFICMEFNFKNNTRETLSFTKHDAYNPNMEYQQFDMTEKGKPEYKEMFAKKEKDEYFMAWSAAVKVTTPAPPSGSAKTFTFTHEKPAASYLSYEKTGSQKPTAITQVLASGATELYLPILRDGKLFYLYVNSKDDVDVKEIDGNTAPTGGVLNYEIDGHEVQVENINPDFYNWWLDGEYILNPPTPTAASVTRGSKNLIDLWKALTKKHGNDIVLYDDLPVGALFFTAKRKKYPTTFEGLSIVLETETELKGKSVPTHQLKITVTKKGEITGTDSTKKLYSDGKLKIMNAEDAITFLETGDNTDKFEKLIASNSILAAEFAKVSTALPATAPPASTGTATSL